MEDFSEMANAPNPKLQNYPLVTAFVGCYNHSRFVEECLDSVRHQTYPNLQVIIFDDGSKDNSVSVIDTWLKKHRLDWQFISHTRNVGICASLNEVLRLARGKYASMVAADDVWLPDKTARQVEMMEQLPEGDWRTVISLSVGALVCSFFWEMWNYYSFPKWIYHIPGLGFLRIFEMPILGYGGYIPFALELYALKNFLWPNGPRLEAAEADEGL